MTRRKPPEHTAAPISSLSDEVLAAIRACAEQGLTAREAARKLRLKPNTVWRAAKRMGIRMTPGSTHPDYNPSRRTQRAPGTPNFAGLAANLRWGAQW